MENKKKVKAIIADDEQIIIELIKRLGNWEELGIDIIATAPDGRSAIQLIEKEKPDIVILDIRMPEIDGMELIGLCKERGVLAQFLIISGHQEFDYAKQAISFNVSEYLVKPIDKDELNFALKKMTDKIQSAEIFTQQVSDMQDKIVQQNMVLWDQLFADLDSKSFAEIDLATFNRKYSSNFQKGSFRILLSKFDIDCDIAALYNGVLNEFLENEIKERVGELLLYDAHSAFDLKLCYLFNYGQKDEKKILQELAIIAEKAQNYMRKYGNCAVTFSVSSATTDISKLGELYAQAVLCNEYRRADNNAGKTYIYGNLSKRLGDQKEEVLLGDEVREELYDLFQTYNLDRLRELVQTITKQPTKDLQRLYKSYRLLQVFSDHFLEIIENYNFNNDVVDEYSERVQYTFRHEPALSVIFDKVETLLIQAYSNIIEGKAFWNDRHIRSIKHYIESNYQSQIGLDDIADAVNLNAS